MPPDAAPHRSSPAGTATGLRHTTRCQRLPANAILNSGVHKPASWPSDSVRFAGAGRKLGCQQTPLIETQVATSSSSLSVWDDEQQSAAASRLAGAPSAMRSRAPLRPGARYRVQTERANPPPVMELVRTCVAMKAGRTPAAGAVSQFAKSGASRPPELFVQRSTIATAKSPAADGLGGRQERPLVDRLTGAHCPNQPKREGVRNRDDPLDIEAYLRYGCRVRQSGGRNSEVSGRRCSRDPNHHLGWGGRPP
jgi:hypothetical protein